jgi:peptidylprolyl isomerase
MTKLWKTLAVAVAAILLLVGRPAAAADPENTLVMELPWGKVVIEMLPDLAPQTCARIKELVRKGFYDGTPFHRVIADFMAQGGDPTGTGTGGSGVKLPAEFSGEHFERGIVGMARNPVSRNSADSQFFIMLGSAPSLDGNYTIWGRVIDGMANVDKITKGDPGNNGMVDRPDKIVRMQVAADIKK